MASELKSVLDSWVRYEQQAKESEQAALAKTVIENVLKTIKDEKTQKDILASAVAEVERECYLVIGSPSDFALIISSTPVLQSWSGPRLSRVETRRLAVTCSSLNRYSLAFIIVPITAFVQPSIRSLAQHAGSTRLHDHLLHADGHPCRSTHNHLSSTPSTICAISVRSHKSWIPTS